MKIKILNFYELTNPQKKIILDVEILEGEKLIKGEKFVNKEFNKEFIINSIGHINPPSVNYYPLTVNIGDDVDLKSLIGKVFNKLND
jgi:hypothetical protein